MPKHSQTFECGDPSARVRIIMLHGYTASPDEFRELAMALAIRFSAHVVAPLLPGHGTKETNILDVTFDDLLAAARKTFLRETAEGRSYIILGHSMSGYLALLLAAERIPSALILTTTPFVLRPRFRRPWMPWVMRMRTFWKKELSQEELRDREKLFFYPRMPGVALSMLRTGIRRSAKVLPTITCPILTVHNSQDPIADPESGEQILVLSGQNPANKAVVLDHDSHGLYYGPHRELLTNEISVFLKKVVIDR